jgi:thiamine pyrophosphate-dependent acetolactate synthase large subunit-like protein
MSEVAAQPTVADVICECLSSFGVERVFGVVGPQINHTISAIMRSGGKYIQVHNEKSAAIMAAVTAAMTGKLGVCLASVAPGTLSLIPGLWLAASERLPVLALTGQLDTRFLGLEYVQEADNIGVLKPVTVYSQIIASSESAAVICSKACREALSKHGVAHLDIPSDIQIQSASPEPLNYLQTEMRYPYLDEDSVKKAALVLNKCERTLLLVGQGARKCRDLVMAISEKLDAPVFTTWAAMDVLPTKFSNNLGILWMNSSSIREMAKKANCVLMIGTDYTFMQDIFSPECTKIQIDSDSYNLGKRVRIDVPVLGDACHALAVLLKGLQKHDGFYAETARELMSPVRIAIKENAERASKPINPFFAVKALSSTLRDDAIVCLESAGASRYIGYCFDVKNHLITRAGRYGVLGYALPAAIAAKLVYPQREAVAVCGDFGMTYGMAEMLTAVREKIPVKAVVFNNGTQTSETADPTFPKGLNIAVDFRFSKFAEACGAFSRYVEDPEDIAPALSDVFSKEGPGLVEIITSPDEDPRSIARL